MENKHKHLEFIQDTIARIGSNLFVLKGWAVTLIVALFTFIADKRDGSYIFYAFVILITFWIIDGFFLSRERCFRALYDVVRKKDESKIDFSMDYRIYDSGRNTWISSLFSSTLIIFYGSLLMATIVVTMLLGISAVKIEFVVSGIK
jgi:hypothetical protein